MSRKRKASPPEQPPETPPGGGSYVRNADGTLTRQTPVQADANSAPETPAVDTQEGDK